MAELPIGQGLRVLEGRARIVRIMLGVYMAVMALTIIGKLAEAMGRASLDVQRPDPVSLLVAIVYILGLPAFLAAMLIICMWIYRAHANLWAAGVDGLEFTPGWALGWYFIPLANLAKPYQAMRELWTVSLGDRADESNPVVPWWAAWIIGGALSNAAFRLQGKAIVIEILGAIALIVAAFFLSRIVRKVTAAQKLVAGIAEVFA